MGKKKLGKRKKWCQAYRLRGQREKNKLKRIMKHLLRFPGDRTAQSAMDRIK
jgi:hypothetical protein